MDMDMDPITCKVCDIELPDSNKGCRRSLNSHAGWSNFSVVEFLQSQIKYYPDPADYLCVTCFKQVEKGIKSLHVSQSIVNSISKSLASQVSPTRSAEQLPRVSQQPTNEQAVTQSAKKISTRRTLFSSHNEAPTTSSSPHVQVAVSQLGHPKPTRFTVPSRFKKIVQSTRFKSSPYTARTMLRSRNFRKPVVTTINKRINQECKSISKRLSISPFRLKCMKSLKSFKMRVLVKYFKKKAPYLSRCLKAAANGDFPNMVTTAGSILLTSRNKDLCSLQAVISIIMYAGHCSKLTFTRLNKLGLCLSHSRSIELVNELGVDHNRQVLKWKQKLETAGTDIPGGESPQSNPSTDTIPVQESSECSSALTFSSVDKGSSSIVKQNEDKERMLTQQVDELRQEKTVKGKEADLTKELYREQTDSLEAKLQALENELKVTNTLLHERTNQITGLQHDLHEKQTCISSLEDTLQSEREHITSLRERLVSAENGIAERDRTKQEMQERLEAVQTARNEDQEKARSILHTRLSEKQTELQKTQSELEQLQTALSKAVKETEEARCLCESEIQSKSKLNMKVFELERE